MRKREILGIDIGGSGIKGAVVDVATGKFTSQRIRIPTPTPYSPEGVLGAIDEIVKGLAWKGKIGCGFPGVVRSQIIETAVNLGGKKFVGMNLAEEIGRMCGKECWVINDGDAAGSAELRFGAGKNRKGLVLMLTVGTGIGTSLFIDGKLVPNTELGHLKMHDKRLDKYVSAEKICSDSVRKARDLQWKQWTEKFNKYVDYLHLLLWPDLVIIGGGIASKSDKFFKYIKADCDIVIAEMENRAGIIGAAYEASKVIS